MVANSRGTKEHNPRDNLPLGERLEVPRDRYDLAIIAELVDRINDYSEAGGWFRSPGDAVEKAIGRLANEEDFIRARCAQERVPYDHQAFLDLYDEDRARIPQPPRGPAKMGAEKEQPGRVLVRAHMAIAMADYGKRSWVATKYLPRLAQVAELGLMRLFRGDGFRIEADQQEPRTTTRPDLFWNQYLKAVRQASTRTQE